MKEQTNTNLSIETPLNHLMANFNDMISIDKQNVLAQELLEKFIPEWITMSNSYLIKNTLEATNIDNIGNKLEINFISDMLQKIQNTILNQTLITLKPIYHHVAYYEKITKNDAIKEQENIEAIKKKVIIWNNQIETTSSKKNKTFDIETNITLLSLLDNKEIIYQTKIDLIKQERFQENNIKQLFINKDKNELKVFLDKLKESMVSYGFKPYIDFLSTKTNKKQITIIKEKDYMTLEEAGLEEEDVYIEKNNNLSLNQHFFSKFKQGKNFSGISHYKPQKLMLQGLLYRNFNTNTFKFNKDLKNILDTYKQPLIHKYFVTFDLEFNLPQIVTIHNIIYEWINITKTSQTYSSLTFSKDKIMSLAIDFISKFQSIINIFFKNKNSFSYSKEKYKQFLQKKSNPTVIQQKTQLFNYYMLPLLKKYDTINNIKYAYIYLKTKGLKPVLFGGSTLENNKFKKQNLTIFLYKSLKEQNDLNILLNLYFYNLTFDWHKGEVYYKKNIEYKRKICPISYFLSAFYKININEVLSMTNFIKYNLLLQFLVSNPNFHYDKEYLHNKTNLNEEYIKELILFFTHNSQFIENIDILQQMRSYVEFLNLNNLKVLNRFPQFLDTKNTMTNFYQTSLKALTKDKPNQQFYKYNSPSYLWKVVHSLSIEKLTHHNLTKIEELTTIPHNRYLIETQQIMNLYNEDMKMLQQLPKKSRETWKEFNKYILLDIFENVTYKKLLTKTLMSLFNYVLTNDNINNLSIFLNEFKSLSLNPRLKHNLFTYFLWNEFKTNSIQLKIQNLNSTINTLPVSLLNIVFNTYENITMVICKKYENEVNTMNKNEKVVATDLLLSNMSKYNHDFSHMVIDQILKLYNKKYNLNILQKYCTLIYHEFTSNSQNLDKAFANIKQNLFLNMDKKYVSTPNIEAQLIATKTLTEFYYILQSNQPYIIEYRNTLEHIKLSNNIQGNKFLQSELDNQDIIIKNMHAEKEATFLFKNFGFNYEKFASIDYNNLSIEIRGDIDLLGFLGSKVSGVCIDTLSKQRNSHFNKGFKNLIVRNDNKIYLWGLLLNAYVLGKDLRVEKLKKLKNEEELEQEFEKCYVLNNFQGSLASRDQKIKNQLSPKILEAFNQLDSKVYFQQHSFNYQSLALKSMTKQTLYFIIPSNTRMDFREYENKFMNLELQKKYTIIKGDVYLSLDSKNNKIIECKALNETEN